MRKYKHPCNFRIAFEWNNNENGIKEITNNITLLADEKITIKDFVVAGVEKNKIKKEFSNSRWTSQPAHLIAIRYSYLM